MHMEHIVSYSTMLALILFNSKSRFRLKIDFIELGEDETFCEHEHRKTFCEHYHKMSPVLS